MRRTLQLLIIIAVSLPGCTTWTIPLPQHRVPRVDPTSHAPMIAVERDPAREIGPIEEQYGPVEDGVRPLGGEAVYGYLVTEDSVEDWAAAAMEEQLRGLGYPTRQVPDAVDEPLALSFEIHSVWLGMVQPGSLFNRPVWGAKVSVRLRLVDADGLIEEFQVAADDQASSPVTFSASAVEAHRGALLDGCLVSVSTAAAAHIDDVLRREGHRAR